MNSSPTTTDDLHLALWQDRLQDAVDQALAPSELLAVQTHLAVCAICAKAHSRLLAVDAGLRHEFAAAPKPSVNFDRLLFAAIATAEQDKRATAREQELQEYAARMTRWREGWRELFRFHLGSVIGGIATLGALATAIISAWPTLTRDLAGAQQLAWLPQGWTSALPTAVIASATVAIAAIWITRRLESRSN
jgi:hypothetical protein